MASNDDKINQILGSSQKISEKYLELGQKYFNVTPDTIKSGMFGYTNEIIAHATKQGIFHRNMMYNEYFFNTASLPSSIYNFATNYNVNVDNATPSKCQIIMGMNVNEMKRIAEPEQDNSTIGIFTLSRSETKFIMGDFIFMLPYDIKIRIDGNTMVAQYDIQSTTFNADTTSIYNNNPFIVTYQDTINVGSTKQQFVFLRIDIYQYEQREDVIEIKTNNLQDQLYFTIQFQNQLVDFDINYTGAQQTQSEILPKFLNTVTLSDQVQKFVMYNYVDEDQYAIMFPVSERRFRPEFNSQISAITYVSQGTAGNFIYTGNVIFNSDNSDVNKMSVSISIQNNPAGGKDRPTIKELKQSIFRVIKSNNSLTTEDDLNDFFQTVTAQNFQNNSRVKFIKYRDDIIRREFNAFILVVDTAGIPIHTNTVDVYTTQNELEVNKSSIPSGAIVIYDSQQNKYRFLRQSEYPEEFMTKNNTFVYSFPYLGNIQFDPYLRVTFFNNYVNQNILTQYTSISSGIEKSINFTQINVTRNPVLTKQAAVRCVITSDEIMKGLSPTFEVYAIFETNNQNKSLNTTLGYKKMDYSSENRDFYTTITMTDTFNSANKMLISQSLKDINTGQIIDEQSIPEEINVRFAVVEVRSGIKDETMQNGFDEISELTNYRPIAYLDIESPVKLYESMNDIVRSEVFVDTDGTVKFSKLPLVGSATYFNTVSYTSFMNQYLDYVSVLRDNFGRLKNNTDVNVKFFNSYGLSYLYDIDRVDLQLNLEVKLSQNYSAELDNQIKQFIIDYVIGLNDSTAPRLSISNLITSLEQNFQEISYINFKQLNGSPISNISYIRDTQTLQEQNISITPEVLSIGYIKKNPDLGQPDVPNITIKYI